MATPLSGRSWPDVAVGPEADGVLIAKGGELCSAQSRADLRGTLWGSPHCKCTLEAAGPLGAQSHHDMATLVPHHPQRRIWGWGLGVLSLLCGLDQDV